MWPVICCTRNLREFTGMKIYITVHQLTTDNFVGFQLTRQRCLNNGLALNKPLSKPMYTIQAVTYIKVHENIDHKLTTYNFVGFQLTRPRCLNNGLALNKPLSKPIYTIQAVTYIKVYN